MFHEKSVFVSKRKHESPHSSQSPGGQVPTPGGGGLGVVGGRAVKVYMLSMEICLYYIHTILYVQLNKSN